MPKMGDAMEEGTLVKWLQSEGDEVPERDGGAAEGGGEAEEEAEEGGDGEAQAQTATETEEEEGTAEEQPQAGGEPSGDGAQTDGQVRASPIVRRLARENDLDLSRIEGSGPQGRIVERDVRAALESGEAPTTDGQAETEAPEAPAEEQPQEAPQAIWQPPRLPEPTGASGTEVRAPSRMQKVIAERMTESKQQAPYFYATVEVRMDMAMAVALDEGLITPVIRDAAKKGLAAISQESKDLAKRARDGDLTPDEYQGGTITVSNMGMFGVESFTAIINPPQAAIVAVSSIIKRP